MSVFLVYQHCVGVTIFVSPFVSLFLFFFLAFLLLAFLSTAKYLAS